MEGNPGKGLSPVNVRARKLSKAQGVIALLGKVRGWEQG
jgi:hypothetical protein